MAKVNHAKNLPSNNSTKRRKEIPLLEKSLAEMCKIPKKNHILGRYLFFYDSLKSKDVRKAKIKSELKCLWAKLNFPILSDGRLSTLLTNLIKKYENYRKHTKQIKFSFNDLFDLTKLNGNWLCEEDKRLYKLQVKSVGQIGYTTSKVASNKTIHPSKRQRRSSPMVEIDTSLSEELPSAGEDSDSSYSPDEEKRPKHFSAKIAAKIAIVDKISTRKASRICSSIANAGIDIPTPSQYGIWKCIINQAKKKKKELKQQIKDDLFCLHFDGKRMNHCEYQVVCLQSSTRDTNLGLAKCNGSTSNEIFQEIKFILNDFNAWSSIKMIVSDTTAVNTGRRNGVVVQLQEEMSHLKMDKAQFVGCQHHILDTILKHVLNFLLLGTTKKPEIEYDFISELQKSYEELQLSYTGIDDQIRKINPGWRSDFKFLYDLCIAFRFYKGNFCIYLSSMNIILFLKEIGTYLKINWRKLPSLNAARWNSRAIFCLIGYFLLPQRSDSLYKESNFISYQWMGAWYSGQKFNEKIATSLKTSLESLKVFYCCKFEKIITFYILVPRCFE